MVGRGSTDEELRTRILTGDKRAFATVYDRYADRLYDYAYSLLRDHAEAADAIVETFLVVANRLNQLDDPDLLLPWLYAITRNCTLDALRARRDVLERVEDLPDIGVGPNHDVERNELRDLVWAATARLGENDQSLLNLHLRHGLDGSDLGAAMGISASQATAALVDVRDQIERSIGALLIARVGRGGCEVLQQVLGDWNGTYSSGLGKRVVRHVEACPTCSARRQALPSPWTLLGSVPLMVAPSSLRDRVLGDVHLVALSNTAPAYRRPIIIATAVLLLVAAILAVVLWWPRPKPPHPPLADVTPPDIITQSISAATIFDQGCEPQRTTVTAEVTDDDAVALVEVRWDGPSSTTMKNVNGVWTATLGPFFGARLIHWQVVATDSSGNVTFGADQVLRVDTCADPTAPKSTTPAGG